MWKLKGQRGKPRFCISLKQRLRKGRCSERTTPPCEAPLFTSPLGWPGGSQPALSPVPSPLLCCQIPNGPNPAGQRNAPASKVSLCLPSRHKPRCPLVSTQNTQESCSSCTPEVSHPAYNPNHARSTPHTKRGEFFFV